MRFAAPLLALTWIGVLAALWLMMQLGSNFLPQFDEGSVQVNVGLPAGSSLGASEETARLIDDKFRRRQKSAARSVL